MKKQQEKYKDWYWLNKDSRTFLKRDYLKENQEPEDRVKQIADTAEEILKIKGFSNKFENYMKKGFYSLSTPIWINFGNERGNPISCNGSYIEDTLASILDKVGEIGYMTKTGAGTSAYFGDLRPRGAAISVGGTSSGPVHFMQLFDATTNVISQSSARRGQLAAYLPIDHPDIDEFLKIRDEGNPIQTASIGVCISNKWMESMIDGDKPKRDIWVKIIKKRFESGYPYLFFTDNVNDNAPQVYKDNNLKIHASNLCSEIALSSSSEESFVCNLSSINLLHWDKIKDTDAIETLTYFLDAVMTEYLDKIRDNKFMQAAYNFASKQRALGVGVLGWHSLLQSKMIPFESMDAKYLNTEIWQAIQKRTKEASKEMAGLYGEPELLKGYNLRNITTMAIAPTTSSSFILGQTSPSIEPLNSNYFVDDQAKGKFTYKNPFLEEVLEKYDKNTSAIWKSILVKGGSVQHLEFLTEKEKDVFKTFGEISQKEIVIQAIARQKYIDQSQSLNLMIPASTPIKEVNQLLIFGWENGIKTFYYQRSTNPALDLSRSILTCKSCES